MMRPLLHLFSLASATALAAVVGLWVRSYHVRDEYRWFKQDAPSVVGYRALSTEPGVVRLRAGTYVYEGAAPPFLVNCYRRNYSARWNHEPAKTSVASLAKRRWRPATATWKRTSTRGGGSALHTSQLQAPFWMPAAAALVVPGIWCCLGLRRKVRFATGHCPCCGYDLRATPERCPECGMVVAERSGPSPGSLHSFRCGAGLAVGH